MTTPGIALVRKPVDRLAEGLVTHIERAPVDLALAREQHVAYLGALVDSGWRLLEVAPAEDCPDSVFVEDVLVVCGGTAIVTRPGTPTRLPEIDGVAAALGGFNLVMHRIEAPGTLDGGDVLQVGTTVYAGRGGRTNAEGIRQLRAILAPIGRTVVAVPLTRVLIAASAPRTAEMIADLGFSPVVVDISEFEKLEGSVTCMSVLVPGDSAIR